MSNDSKPIARETRVQACASLEEVQRKMDEIEKALEGFLSYHRAMIDGMAPLLPDGHGRAEILDGMEGAHNALEGVLQEFQVASLKMGIEWSRLIVVAHIE